MTAWHWGEIARAVQARGVADFSLHTVKGHCPGWLECLLSISGMGLRLVTMIMPERPPTSGMDLEHLRGKWDYELREVKGRGENVFRALDKM